MGFETEISDQEFEIIFFDNSNKSTSVSIDGAVIYIYHDYVIDITRNCPESDFVNYEEDCKIIKNESNKLIEQCYEKGADGLYKATYEYTVSGDVLTLKTYYDYLDGSEIKYIDMRYYRKTSLTLGSYCEKNDY